MFSASTGDLLGPFKNDGSFQLILIEEVIRAKLEGGVKEAIRERIFREWLFLFLKEGITIIS